MTCPLSDEQLIHFAAFIDQCQKNPTIINHPKLSFFKNFIEKLGGKVPRAELKVNEDASEPIFEEPQSEPEPESDESDLELDTTGVIEPDNDAPQAMGDLELEPTEEQIEESHDKRSQAVSAFMEKDYEKAIKLYTEAIQLNPQASLLYAKRGQVYILLNKPNACIRDCDRAIELNPDSAAAHKFRGRAYQLLGKWEEAANDLRKACKFDFDEQADEWLREVTPNARKIEEHKRKQERKVLERSEREKLERLRKVQEAQAKARAEAEKQRKAAEDSMSGDGGFGAGFGAGAGAGAGAGGGGPNMSQFAQFLQDPEILTAFQDPEVAAAFKDISSNPGNIFKYQNNPKIMSLIGKVSAKFGGGAGGAGGMPGGGMPGGFPGGFPGMGGMGGMPNFPGMGGEAPNAPPKPDADDFNLD